MRTLVAIPVFNEERSLACVLGAALKYSPDVLVVDDGSTDGGPAILAQFPAVRVLRHPKNQGYGASLRDAFAVGVQQGFDAVVTLDSDGQHAPSLIPQFIAALADADIASGSRYLRDFDADTPAPKERRRINQIVTDQLNACLGLKLTDSFCGYKGYRCSALRLLSLTEPGYGMPLELWVQAACLELRVTEVPVPRVYLDPNRTFGERLDDPDVRIAYYQRVIDDAVAAAQARGGCRRIGTRRPVLTQP